jgi:hypothetical protein
MPARAGSPASEATSANLALLAIVGHRIETAVAYAVGRPDASVPGETLLAASMQSIADYGKGRSIG